MSEFNICIPALNYDVSTLVSSLYSQIKKTNSAFRIIVFEDGSDKTAIEKNAKLIERFGIVHLISDKNIGRSAARNFLADSAGKGKIIFLDCDSALPDDDFISRYISNADKDVVCGGTIYLPEQKTLSGSLRYKYGISREMKTAELRNRNSNAAFATNNFMISYEIFKQVRFREFLKEYGHEDSLFGYELKANGIRISHIDNPVIHEGIESNSVFLSKTLSGLKNLKLIEQSQITGKEFTNDVKIVKTYHKLRKTGLDFFVKLFFNVFKNIIEKHLLISKNPKLLLFDLYKIGYYCKIKKLK
jgi:glycosyltransferase involved in cell wall biosynthesis